MRTILKILLALILVLGVAGGLSYYYIVKQLEQDFPEPAGEFEMQGVMWSTHAYYDHPLIYRSVYNPVSDALTITKAKQVGANWVLMKAFYSGSAEGEVIGNDEELEQALSTAIADAHENGLKVFLIPFVDSHDYWVLEEWTLEPETWTPYVLQWADFADRHQVEMFAPGIEMNLIFSQDEAGPWFQEILPRIRNVYDGKIVTAEHPYLDAWPALIEKNAFEGYDCIGISLYPWVEYGEMIDILSYEEYLREVDDKIALLNEAADEFNIDCKIIAPLGMDYWRGGWPDAPTRTHAYELALDSLTENDFDGVFLHIWYQDGRTKNLYTNVGEMLRERWTVSQEDE